MSIKKIILTAAIAFSAFPAQSQERNQSREEVRQEYIQLATRYAKELMGAVYSEKTCKDFRLKVNPVFFKETGYKPIWDEKTTEKFLAPLMHETKLVIEKIVKENGREGWCKGYINFNYEQYGSFGNQMPIVIETNH